MIDQLVASRGKIFFGCFFSTFTGYINRIRYVQRIDSVIDMYKSALSDLSCVSICCIRSGYHSVKDKLPGYKSGELPTTYYYATIDKKFEMHKVR
jgi:hypothetical protein